MDATLKKSSGEQWPVNAEEPRPDYGTLAEAFAQAQAVMVNPSFDTTNPHFKSRFASLAAVRNATIPVLAKFGICVSQDIRAVDGGISCLTILIHASGQRLEFGPLVLPVSKHDAQGFGSAATYARRYSLMAACGVAGDDDDDGNAATKAAPEKPAAEVPEDCWTALADAAAIGNAAVTKFMKEEVSEETRALIIGPYKAKWETIKAIAAANTKARKAAAKVDYDYEPGSRG